MVSKMNLPPFLYGSPNLTPDIYRKLNQVGNFSVLTFFLGRSLERESYYLACAIEISGFQNGIRESLESDDDPPLR